METTSILAEIGKLSLAARVEKGEISVYGQASEGQLALWRKEFGEVLELYVENSDATLAHVAYLRKPSFAIFSSVLSERNQLERNRAMLMLCWLGGSEDVKKEDNLLISACVSIGELESVKIGYLKKNLPITPSKNDAKATVTGNEQTQ